MIEWIEIDLVSKEFCFCIIGVDKWLNEDGFVEFVFVSGIIGICGFGIIEVVVEMCMVGIVDVCGLIGSVE